MWEKRPARRSLVHVFTPETKKIYRTNVTVILHKAGKGNKNEIWTRLLSDLLNLERSGVDACRSSLTEVHRSYTLMLTMFTAAYICLCQSMYPPRKASACEQQTGVMLWSLQAWTREAEWERCSKTRFYFPPTQLLVGDAVASAWQFLF